MERAGARRLSRRGFIQVAGGAVAASAVGAGAFEAVSGRGETRATLPSLPVRPTGPVRSFHSRPDLRPPTISVTGSQNLDRGYMFMDPWVTRGNQPGPLMVDRHGEPVWFEPVSSSPTLVASNFRPFIYRGEPVLVWWEGQFVTGPGELNGLGRGEAIIVDRSYREIARVRPANGRQMDLHEFQLTPQGTALFSCYPETVPADLRSIGGPRHGSVLNSIYQEVDVRTGHLLLEWRSLDHIAISECYPLSTPDQDLNYLHLNSIGLTPDGNLLISGRHTWALYKIDRRTGQVIWRLGGKRSDFTIDPDAQFSEQHDARQLADGTITLFDNWSAESRQVAKYSRGVVLKVDEARRRVSLAHAFRHPVPFIAHAMGSVQILPSGNAVVGWGSVGYFSQFDPAGRLLTDGRQLSGWQSYRNLLLPWRGTPQRPPDLAVEHAPRAGRTTVYASWNGDTESAYWRVHVGPRRSDMRPIGIARRRGFETAIPLGNTGGYFSVTALDHHRRPLAHSAVVRST